jgi:type IV pilus assembly protein PilA
MAFGLLYPAETLPRARAESRLSGTRGEIMRNLRGRGGFTLIELMITVAIVGILASVAIPQFYRYQIRSRRAEAMTNLRAIVKTEVAYFGDTGVFLGAAPMPPGFPNIKRRWDAVSKAEYDPIGFAPEGDVVFAYEVNTFPADCSCGLTFNGEAACFTAAAFADLDNDGSLGVVAYFHAETAADACVTAVGPNPVPNNPNTGLPILKTVTVLPPGAGADDY